MPLHDTPEIPRDPPPSVFGPDGNLTGESLRALEARHRLRERRRAPGDGPGNRAVAIWFWAFLILFALVAHGVALFDWLSARFA